MLFKAKKRYGLALLNLTQFTVVLVDNIFKLLIAFFLIDLQGSQAASSVLSLVGAIYVLPFLLLSSFGGSLADRFSKQTITICIKCLGGLIILSAFYIFSIKSVFGCYCLLFLLSTQSAIFGPSKYGMIPELVPQIEIPKANGYITSFTYLAIILGTFLGSFLSDILNRNYLLILTITLCFSVTGIVASFFIPKTEKKQKSAQTIDLSALKVISSYPKKAHLGISMVACALFLLIGSFTQLAIIPFAINILYKTEFIGGYLFLTTALGIALGSWIVGKLSKKGPNLFLATLGGLILGVMLIALGFFVTSIQGALVCLILMGISGGFYIVPLESFIQMTALDEHRGRILGINNLLGFTGVLAASFFLFLLIHLLKLSITSAFMILGCVELIFILYFIAKISDRLLALYFSFQIFKKIPQTIIPSHIHLLIVPQFKLKLLSSLIFSKTRVRFLSEKSSFFPSSCLLKIQPNQDLISLINQELDPNQLLIIEKKMILFDLAKIKGKVGELEEAVKT